MRVRNNDVVKAFTLVELLVTIMIIIILAGTLLPVISGAKKRGRDVLCKNNLKQLQVGAMNFAMFNASEDRRGGLLPHDRSGEVHRTTRNPSWQQERTGWIDWVNYASHNDNSTTYRPGETPWWGAYGLTCITNGTMWEYVNSTKAYACPEWQQSIVGKVAPDNTVVLSLSDGNRYPWRCYAMNSSVSGANIGDIEASKRILFAEASSTNFYNGVQISQTNLCSTYDANQLTAKTSAKEALGWDGSLSITPVSGQNYPQENVGLHHDGKANVIFVDGHIESLAWSVTTNAASGNW